MNSITRIQVGSRAILATAVVFAAALGAPGALAATVCDTGSPDFSTLAAAVADANANFPTGGVTYDVCAGFTETAPAGGYVLTSQGSVGSPIVFQKSGAGANPTITASASLTAGALNDGIFKIVGGDYITIDGFTLQENPANTTTAAATNNMTEWGVALLQGSATNGSQNNTIRNCTISLNRGYTNSFGVYSNTRHSATAPTTASDITDPTNGPNSGNRVHGNTISNVNFGVVFIGSATAANQDVGNDVGGASAGTGNTISNWGGAAAASAFVSLSATSMGVYMNHQTAMNVSHNTLTSAAVSGTSVTLRGILSDFLNTSPTGTFTNTISNNTVTLTSGFTSGTFEAIRQFNSAGTAASGVTLNITSNLILNCAVTGASSSSAIVGILNGANFGTVNLNGNTVRGATSTATTGGFTGVQNAGAVVTAININNNKIGDSIAGAITFSAATSGAVLGVSNATGAGAVGSTASLSNNDVRGIVHSVAGSSTHTYVQQLAGNPSTNINSNTFTDLNVNTTGSVTLITNNVTHAAGTTHNVNNNSIVTAFNKAGAGGTVRFYDSFGVSPATVTETNTGNTFSNVTVTGATTLEGWRSADGTTPGSRKSVTNNTFENITGGTSAVTVMNVGFSDNTFASNNVSGNTISNVSGGGSVTGITSSSQNQNFFGNTISGLSSSGASSTVVGIAITGGTTQNVSANTISGLSGTGTTSPVANGISVSGGTTVSVLKNKIYDISQSAAISTTSPAINGILLSGGTTVTAHNNLVGDLRAPAASLTDAIRGISVTSTTGSTTFNVFYNTVRLAAMSSGANFGTTGIFHAASSTATTAALNLRNNVIANLSEPKGTGLTVAFRRSAGGAGTLANYASSSNHNDFFAGSPGASNLIYSDSTSTAQTIGAYKSGAFTAGTIAPRDSSSFTENPPFLSTSGASSNFLHVDPTVATQLESGALNIAGITDDFDGETRQGNAGYPGTGTAPDVGADEFEGIALDLSPPAITYAPLGNATASASRVLPNVVVTDPSGVNTASGTRPRAYYRKTCGTPAVDNTFNDNTNATPGFKFVEATGTGGSPFSFTIDHTLLPACSGGSGAGVVAVGDVIQYFVVAEDNAAAPNVGINAGTFAAAPSSVDLTSAAFPIGGTINSYTIVASLSGARTVCSTGCDHSSLTNAGGLFEAINGSVVVGNLTATVSSDLTAESGAVALNRWVEEGAGGYTLTIGPDSATLRTVSGSVAAGMIRLNGAQRTTFDGRFAGSGQFLLFRNTSTSGQTFVFINDATNNTIQSSIVEGANSSTTSGTILFSTSTGTLGNSSNTIADSAIRDRSDAAGVPANAVYSSGTSTAPNGSNTISSCNIFNYTNAGVLVSSTGAGSGWTVNPTSFFQTASRSAALWGISIQGGSGHSIVGNSIGGSAPGASGSHLATSSTFRGIDLSVGTAAPTSVQGNTIRNIRSTTTAFTSSYGIFVQAGRVDLGTVTGNTVGSADPALRFEINGDSYGIRAVSTSTVNVHNNTVNNFVSTTTGPTPPTGQFYFGIAVEGTAGAHSVFNNTVTNVTNASVPDSSFSTQTVGMIVSATGAQTVRGNRISNVGSTSATAPTSNNNRVWGLILSATGAGTVVENNVIAGLFASSAGAGARIDVVTGLQSQSSANGTYTNNMVATSGGGSPSDRAIFGILDLSAAPAVSNYYFNSVNVTGTASGTGVNSTYAFNRNSTATVTLRNNAFANSRSGGTGFHVAMANTNAAATGWSSTASNHNLVFNATPAHVTQWLGSASINNQTLSGFRSASGGDASSLEGDPLFTSSTDLHINISGGPSPVENAGIQVAGVLGDIDGDGRGAVPDIGADEVLACSVANCASSGTDCGDASCNSDGLSGNCSILTAKPAGTACRAAAGDCDVTEFCDGANTGACPTDVFVPSGTECRAVAGDCDVAESCTGSSAACPRDDFVDAGTECRAADGACDVAEACTGASPTCPSDGFAASGTTCRAATDACDAPESCTGSSAACPPDDFVDAGVECRPAAGSCDVAESCTGSSASCPDDALADAGTECRAAAGDCDVAEACTGASAACPADGFVDAGVECRPAAGDCDVAESCTGSSATCPANDFVDAGTECRAAAGDCDVAESCTGVSPACPADGLADAGTECRPAAGSCDVAEACDGFSAACPADDLVAGGTECRAAAGDCDVAEACTGTSAACPADDFVPAGTVCRPSSGGLCDPAEECSGKTAACPPDAFDRNAPLSDSLRLAHDSPSATTVVNWVEAEPGPFNVYRGSRTPGVPFSYNHTCFLQDVTGSAAADTEAPASGVTFYYLVSRVRPPCSESSLGVDSSSVERPNASPCSP